MKRAASFKFDSYKLINFSFTEASIKSNALTIDIDPHGIYYEDDKIFELTFNFKADLPKSTINVVSVKMKAYFSFEGKQVPFEKIPDYFYRNSIAIVFPYLRSFISTLTLLANIKVVNLPVLNLSDLEKPLKDQTTVEKTKTEAPS